MLCAKDFENANNASENGYRLVRDFGVDGEMEAQAYNLDFKITSKERKLVLNEKFLLVIFFMVEDAL